MQSPALSECSLPPGWLRRLPGAAFTFLLAVGGGLALRAASGVPRVDQTANFEEQLDARLAYREGAIAAWGVVEYALFGEGRPGVVVGTEGWLYTAEELEEPAGAQAALDRKVALAVGARALLHERGAELLVVPIPSKARLVQAHLGGVRVPETLRDRYARFVDVLLSRGVPVVDLRPALAVPQGAAASFLRTDTHWSPEGAARAAHAVAKSAPEIAPHTAFALRRGSPRLYQGDLLRFLPLGALQARWGPPLDVLAVPTAERVEALGLFDDLALPVALVGTSYSADPTWGFQAALRVELQADVLNASSMGEGPVEPLLAYLDDERVLSEPQRLVIWEVPERYLSVRYTSDDHAALAAHLLAATGE